MSATDRLNLIVEIKNSTKVILDELNNQLDIADSYLERMRKAEQDINKAASHIKQMAARIETHLKEYHLREMKVLDDELRGQESKQKEN